MSEVGPSAFSNGFGQPVGRLLSGWVPPPRPSSGVMEGRWCRLEPLDPARHAAGLFEANREDVEGRMWTYLPYGPFGSVEVYRAWMESSCLGADPLFFAIVDRVAGVPLGLAAYLRIEPAHGVIEVGHLAYSPRLQRTCVATEAMYLMMRQVFALGYRRYEWKCDALNLPSRAAAGRLGFRFEGVFRQAAVVKGRSRDTAWYSVVDAEWVAVRRAMEAWLEPGNFGPDGRQLRSLGVIAGMGGAGGNSGDEACKD